MGRLLPSLPCQFCQGLPAYKPSHISKDHYHDDVLEPRICSNRIPRNGKDIPECDLLRHSMCFVPRNASVRGIGNKRTGLVI